MSRFLETAKIMLSDRDGVLSDGLRLETALEIVMHAPLQALDTRSYPYESEPHNMYIVSTYSNGGRKSTLHAMAVILNILLPIVARLNQHSVERQLETMATLYDFKNADYGGAWEREVLEMGVFPLYIRLREKLNRALQLTRKEAMVKDEKLVDTLTDVCNYCIITYMIL